MISENHPASSQCIKNLSRTFIMHPWCHMNDPRLILSSLVFHDFHNFQWFWKSSESIRTHCKSISDTPNDSYILPEWSYYHFINFIFMVFIILRKWSRVSDSRWPGGECFGRGVRSTLLQVNQDDHDDFDIFWKSSRCILDH